MDHDGHGEPHRRRAARRGRRWVGVPRRLVPALMSEKAASRWARLLTWLEDRGMRTDKAHLKVYSQERLGEDVFARQVVLCRRQLALLQAREMDCMQSLRSRSEPSTPPRTSYDVGSRV